MSRPSQTRIGIAATASRIGAHGRLAQRPPAGDAGGSGAAAVDPAVDCAMAPGVYGAIRERPGSGAGLARAAGDVHATRGGYPSGVNDEPIDCPRCGESVPAMAYCIRCGASLASGGGGAGRAGRRGSYAAAPGESVTRVALFSTLLP